MIDFMKAQIVGLDINTLKSNPNLNFCVEVNPETGELNTSLRNGKTRTPHLEAKYQSLIFKVYDSGRVIMQGSLHKFWNDGEHNHNDFTIEAIEESLVKIEALFGIKAENMVLQGIELGVNIRPRQCVDKILKHLFFHKKQPFYRQKVNGQGNYIQAEHDQFIIKIYNKGRQYALKDNLLRIELKIKKMVKLKCKQMTLQGLFNHGLHNFIGLLIDEWNASLLYDFTIRATKGIQINYSNPLYWAGLIESGRASAYKKHLAKHKEIVAKYSDDIKSQIANLIRDKATQLVGSDRVSHFTNTSKQICRNKGIPFHQDLPSIKPLLGYPYSQFNYSMNKVTRQAKLNRRCVVTGLDISMQKEDSFLLSINGLRYCYETDRKTFEQVQRRFLSKKWLDAPLEVQINEIYHGIRHRYETLSKKYKRLYREEQLQLFSV